MNPSKSHEPALADCPHCGCRATLSSVRIGKRSRMVQVRCGESMCCDTRGPKQNTIKEAIKTWNTMFLNCHER
jgi:hypothetical protein